MREEMSTFFMPLGTINHGDRSVSVNLILIGRTRCGVVVGDRLHVIKSINPSIAGMKRTFLVAQYAAIALFNHPNHPNCRCFLLPE